MGFLVSLKGNDLTLSKARFTKRQLQAQIRLLLQSHDWEAEIQRLFQATDTPQKFISPLLTTLYSQDLEIRWRGISSLGLGVSAIAKVNIEHSRVIMRRLIWNLNDESGGIGWGSPEAQAEIMSNHKQLANEFYKILISYIISRDGPDNYLEYEPLREGAYWGIARLSQVRPDLIQPYQTLLIEALSQESSPQIHAYICLAFNNLSMSLKECTNSLQKIASNKKKITVYWNKSIHTMQLDILARNILQQQTSSFLITTN
jgi:hypothetical protein